MADHLRPGQPGVRAAGRLLDESRGRVERHCKTDLGDAMARSDEHWNRIYGVFQPKNDPLIGQRSRDLYCEREHSPFEQMRADFRPGTDLVPYFNGDLWYDAHPLVWEVLEE